MKRNIFIFAKIFSRSFSLILLGYGIAKYIRHEDCDLALLLSAFLGLLYVELERIENGDSE